FGSTCSASTISEVLTTGVEFVARPEMVSVAVAPLASSGIVQRPVVGVNTPVVAVEPAKLKLVGIGLATTMPLASSGPLLVTMMVNVTSSLRLGDGLSTVWVSDRSATGVLKLTEA